eukprot:maker-scaffold528_size145933-snap-gene-0.24 protein:Tk12221 transcript:maker-scaffold528_size145933-snap-gene-0.24-mRNA-1 annotation:"udp- c:betagal beta- -n-acetylglucosaminyltransferase 5"
MFIGVALQLLILCGISHASVEWNILNLTSVSIVRGDGIQCEDSHLLLILVHSAPDHFELRQAIRETWAGLRPGVRPVFLLGRNDQLDEEIGSESEQHQDIVQGSFVDAYRNMTYKHIFGYRWAMEKCPNVRLILKADDDQVVDTLHLGVFVNSYIPNLEEPFYLCYFLTGQIVARNVENKWFVTQEEYPADKYPGYCSGWAYVTNPNTIREVLSSLEGRSDYFWIDDIFVTGMNRPESVKVYDWRNAFLNHHSQSKEDIVAGDSYSPELLVCSDLSPDQIHFVYAKFLKSYERKWAFDSLYFDHEAKEVAPHLNPTLCHIVVCDGFAWGINSVAASFTVVFHQKGAFLRFSIQGDLVGKFVADAGQKRGSIHVIRIVAGSYLDESGGEIEIGDHIRFECIGLDPGSSDEQRHPQIGLVQLALIPRHTKLPQVEAVVGGEDHKCVFKDLQAIQLGEDIIHEVVDRE